MTSLVPRQLEDAASIKSLTKTIELIRESNILIFKSLVDMKRDMKTGSCQLLTSYGYINYSFVEGDFSDKIDDIFVVEIANTSPTQGALLCQQSESMALRRIDNNGYRNLLEKIREGVSVKDFGAKGDGVTDDRAAIQRAIDWTASRGGGEICIPVGTYRMTVALSEDGQGVSCLTLRSNVSLVGQNPFSSILKMADNQTGPGTFLRGITTNGLIENAVLRNFTYHGNRGGQGVWGKQGNGGNIVIHARKCFIDNIISLEAQGQGIQVRGDKNSIVDRLTISNCIVDGTSGSSMGVNGNVTLEYNGNGIGIQVSQAKDYRIINNSIRNCKDNGIDTYNDSGALEPTGGMGIITGNVITACRCGIFPETSGRMIIAHNYISGMEEAGVAINRITSAPQYLDVLQNTIEYCLAAIRVSGNCDNVRIEGNTIGFIVSGAGAGIYLYNASYVLVKGNIFKIAYERVPLVAIVGDQGVFSMITDNMYFGSPEPGYLTYNVASDTFFTTVEGWRSIDNPTRGQEDPEVFNRPRGSFGSMRAGRVGFNGQPIRDKYQLAGNATDLATSMELLNGVRQLLIDVGLGK